MNFSTDATRLAAGPFAAHSPNAPSLVPATTSPRSPRSPRTPQADALVPPRTPVMGPASDVSSSPSTLGLPSPTRPAAPRLGSPIGLPPTGDGPMPIPWTTDVFPASPERGRRRLVAHPRVLLESSQAEVVALKAFVDGWLGDFSRRWPTRADARRLLTRLSRVGSSFVQLGNVLHRPSTRLAIVTASDSVQRRAAVEASEVKPVSNNAPKLQRSQLPLTAQSLGLGLTNVPGLPWGAVQRTFGALDHTDGQLLRVLEDLQASLGALPTVANGPTPQATEVERLKNDVDAACQTLLAYLEDHPA